MDRIIKSGGYELYFHGGPDWARSSQETTLQTLGRGMDWHVWFLFGGLLPQILVMVVEEASEGVAGDLGCKHEEQYEVVCFH